MSVFEFHFDRAYRLAGIPFGVTPRRTGVILTAHMLEITFGPWSLRTRRANIRSADLTGDYAFLKTAGPPHLSFADRGVSFATNSRSGVCLHFDEPVPGIDPLGLIRHPGATVTVRDPQRLLDALSEKATP